MSVSFFELRSAGIEEGGLGEGIGESGGAGEALLGLCLPNRRGGALVSGGGSEFALPDLGGLGWFGEGGVSGRSASFLRSDRLGGSGSWFEGFLAGVGWSGGLSVSFFELRSAGIEEGGFGEVVGESGGDLSCGNGFFGLCFTHRAGRAGRERSVGDLAAGNFGRVGRAWHRGV